MRQGSTSESGQNLPGAGVKSECACEVCHVLRLLSKIFWLFSKPWTILLPKISGVKRFGGNFCELELRSSCGYAHPVNLSA
jgi:hypothetical protein